MFRRSLFNFALAPINHLGQAFPPVIALALSQAMDANGYKSPVWVTSPILENYAQSVGAEVKPTVVQTSGRPLQFYNSDQVNFYIPKGIGFAYSGPKAKEMVLAAKLSNFTSPYWCSVGQAARKGYIVKKDQQPILISNVPYYNASQLEGAESDMLATEEHIKKVPSLPFRSINGKRYSREKCAELSEFLSNNRITKPGNVWGTAKAFQKFGISVLPRAAAYQVISDEGVVYDMYNSAQTSDPQTAEQLGLNPQAA